MKNITLVLFLVLSACFASRAQGIYFETGSWEEVLKKAKVENKIIFVDVYTQWCGPCKMVSTTVFPQAQEKDDRGGKGRQRVVV